MCNPEEDDILHEISDEYLPNLRDLFKGHWPFALHAYYWVDNYIDWKKRGITNIKFFSPEGKFDDGTFIAIEDCGEYVQIFLFTLEKSCNRLRNALSTTNTIKWNDPNKTILFSAVHEHVQHLVMNEIKKRKLNITHQDISNMFWMPKEEAMKLEYETPDEVYIAPLETSHVNQIDAVWPHRSNYSKQYLTKLITANGGFGLFSKSDNSLNAWILRNNYGGLAILQTAEEHKRKGYGMVLSKHFSKFWAEKGLDIFCFIMTHNEPSLKLFTKLKYRKEHGITWTETENK